MNDSQSEQAIQIATVLDENGPICSKESLLHGLQSAGAFVSIEEIAAAYKAESIEEDATLGIAHLVRIMQQLIQQTNTSTRIQKETSKRQEEGDASDALIALSANLNSDDESDHEEENLMTMLDSFELRPHSPTGGKVTVQSLTSILKGEDNDRRTNSSGKAGFADGSRPFGWGEGGAAMGKGEDRKSSTKEKKRRGSEADDERLEALKSNHSIRGRMKHIHQDTTIYRMKIPDAASAARRKASLAVGTMQMRMSTQKINKPLYELPFKKRVDLATRRIVQFFRVVMAKRMALLQRAEKSKFSRHPGQKLDCTVVGVAKIQVLDGIDLIPLDGTGSGKYWSDPYATLSFGRFYYRQTQCKQKTINPVWREDFQMWVESEDSVLKIKVYDQDYGADDDLIGFGGIPMSCLVKDTQVMIDLLLHIRVGVKHPTRKNMVRFAIQAMGWGLETGPTHVVVDGDTVTDGQESMPNVFTPETMMHNTNGVIVPPDFPEPTKEGKDHGRGLPPVPEASRRKVAHGGQFLTSTSLSGSGEQGGQPDVFGTKRLGAVRVSPMGRQIAAEPGPAVTMKGSFQPRSASVPPPDVRRHQGKVVSAASQPLPAIKSPLGTGSSWELGGIPVMLGRNGIPIHPRHNRRVRQHGGKRKGLQKPGDPRNFDAAATLSAGSSMERPTSGPFASLGIRYNKFVPI